MNEQPPQLPAYPPLPPEPKPLYPRRTYFGDVPRLCPLTQRCGPARSFRINVGPPPEIARPVSSFPAEAPAVLLPAEGLVSPLPQPDTLPQGDPPVAETEAPSSPLVDEPTEIHASPPPKHDGYPYLNDVLVTPEPVIQEPTVETEIHDVSDTPPAPVVETTPEKECDYCTIICKTLGDKEYCTTKMHALRAEEISSKDLNIEFNEHYGPDWKAKVMQELKNKATEGESNVS